MTPILLTFLVTILLAGAVGLFLYSRTQHGFFTLREVRRTLRRVGYTCMRWLNGSARREVGPLP